MKKVVFCIDGMMVGCPATYEKSGVMHRWHDGGLPSNIEKVVFCIDCMMVGAQQHRKSGVLHRCIMVGAQQHMKKWCYA
jgi:hypothetical protein